MHKHDVFEGFFVKYLHEESVFVTGLGLQFNNMTVGMIDFLIIKRLEELAMKFTILLLRAIIVICVVLLFLNCE